MRQAPPYIKETDLYDHDGGDRPGPGDPDPGVAQSRTSCPPGRLGAPGHPAATGPAPPHRPGGHYDEAALRARYRFTDFPAFVQIYVTVCDCLRSGADFALITGGTGLRRRPAEHPLRRGDLHALAPCQRHRPAVRRGDGRHRRRSRRRAGKARRDPALHPRLPA